MSERAEPRGAITLQTTSQVYEPPTPIVLVFGALATTRVNREQKRRVAGNSSTFRLPISSSFAALTLAAAGLSVCKLRSELFSTKDAHDQSITSLRYLEPDAAFISYHTRIVVGVFSFALLFSVCLDWLLWYSIFPKSLFTSILFKTPYTHMATFILLLCLGNHSVSGYTYMYSKHQLSLSLRLQHKRQTLQTAWTLQLKGWPNTGYCTMMRFGIDQQQTFCMLVDTGSANTAVANAPDPALGDYEIFDQSLSGKDFIDVGKAVKVTYSSGEWSGKLVRDKVGFAEFSMEMSHFSLITSSTDFFIEGAEWVGILGMAYQSLAKPDSSVGTVWDSIRRPNALQDVFALQLCPPRESTLFPGTFIKQGGYMTLGGINSSLYQVGKQFHYTRIVEERFYSILLTKVAVGEKVIDVSCKKFNNDKTIVDSGTTDIFFPTEVFQEVKNTFTEYFQDGIPMDVPDEFWSGEQKLLWQAAHVEEIYQSFPTIYLSMAADENSSQEFCLAVVPQLYLRQIDVQVGEADPAVCPANSPCDAFTFGVKPRALGTVIGGNVMLGYYTVFDRENMRVGFAESTCEYRSPTTAPYISGPYVREPEDCQVPPPPVPKWDTITYTCGAVTSFFALVMTVIIFVRAVKRCVQKNTLNKSVGTEIILKTISRGGVCCMEPQKCDDEGYVSCTSDQDSPPASTLSGDCREMSMFSSRVTEQESDSDNMMEVHTAIEEEEEAESTEKKAKKKKRNRKHPVMETEIPARGLDRLCIANSSAASNSSMPGSATVRTYGVNIYALV